MVTALRPKPGPVRTYRFPEFIDQKLPIGIRVVTAPVRKLPVVTVLVIIDAGSTNDPSGKEGVAALTAGLLLAGAAGPNGSAVEGKLERLGTSLEAGGDW